VSEHVIAAGDVFVTVKCAVGLPKMDVTTGACDAYVKVIKCCRRARAVAMSWLWLAGRQGVA